jgi:hypothetical protein
MHQSHSSLGLFQPGHLMTTSLPTSALETTLSNAEVNSDARFNGYRPLLVHRGPLRDHPMLMPSP